MKNLRRFAVCWTVILSSLTIATASTWQVHSALATSQALALEQTLAQTQFRQSGAYPNSMSIPDIEVQTRLSAPTLSYATLENGSIIAGHLSVPAAILPASQIQNGWVNYRIVSVESNGSWQPIAFGSKYLGSDPTQAAQATYAQSQDDQPITLSSQLVKQISDNEQGQLNPEFTIPHICLPQLELPPKDCGTPQTEHVVYKNRFMVVGEAHSRNFVAKVQFTYTHQADSNVSVMESQDFGLTGTFSQSGDVEVDNSKSASIGHPYVNMGNWAHQIEYLFRFSKSWSVFHCYYRAKNSAKIILVNYKEPWLVIQVVNWDGGGGISGKNVSYLDGWGPKKLKGYTISPLSWGDDYTTADQQALTYTTAVSIFGVGLSSTSGFSNGVALEIIAKNHARGCIYGYNKQPVLYAKEIYETYYLGHHCQVR